MSDVFDIGGSAYSNQRKNNDNYIHRHGRNEWLPAEALKDPRLSRRDKEANRYSPSESPHFRGQHSNSPQRDARWRSPETAPQIYNQHSHSQQQYSSQIPPPPPVYSEYNTVYGASATQYQHGYQQSFQPNSNNFSQYSQQRGYPAQAQSSSQGYNSSTKFLGVQ